MSSHRNLKAGICYEIVRENLDLNAVNFLAYEDAVPDES